MSYYSKLSVFLFLLLYLVFPKQASALEQSAQFAQVSQGLGVEVRLLCESGCGREPGTVVTPEKIIMHVTEGAMTKAEGEWQYFNSGSEGRGVGSHYIIGVAGDTIQAVIMGDTQVEFAHTVGGYKEHISIEMQSRRSYDSKDEMPEAQYKAAYDLVRALMQQYNIPLGNVEYDTNYPDDSGVYGHYQLAPGMKTDPGAGWLRDFREELKAGGALTTTGSSGGSRTSTSCWVTEVGDAPDEEKPVCQTGSGGTGLPGQPLPSNDPAQIKQVMCDQYDVCPTESKSNPPSQPWTLEELTALWNITQRIAASTTYKDILLSDATTVVEVQRIQHCPGCADWVNGLQAGIGTAGSSIPGSSLIYITDLAAGQPNTYLEWLYAHEIGHIAQFASNSSYSSVSSCRETVSSYGSGSPGENFADSVSLYMTNGEQAINYLGEQGNLKLDFPCTYNALKDNAFGGVEY